MASSANDENDDTQKEIDLHLDHLTRLLEKKKKKEKAPFSGWPATDVPCSHTPGYAACNPLIPGQCPTEEEFRTNLKDEPFANSWTKDLKTDIHCCPD